MITPGLAKKEGDRAGETQCSSRVVKMRESDEEEGVERMWVGRVRRRRVVVRRIMVGLVGWLL